LHLLLNEVGSAEGALGELKDPLDAGQAAGRAAAGEDHGVHYPVDLTRVSD
jgi:hypothetical protein